jgi:hypothetical protein
LITADLRETVRRLYQYRCGYCGVTEVDAGSELEIDHFHPVSRGGDDGLENLVYCCVACNRFKGSFWTTADAPHRLLHPLRDDLTLHFREEEEGWLAAATEIGRFHLELLHLNRPQLLSQRLKRALIERLEQRLAANYEEGSRWDALTAEGQDELLEMLRRLYRLPNV